jgi:hypothetical protein
MPGGGRLDVVPALGPGGHVARRRARRLRLLGDGGEGAVRRRPGAAADGHQHGHHQRHRRERTGTDDHPTRGTAGRGSAPGGWRGREQRGEIGRGILVTALFGASERRLGLGVASALGEQNAEIARGVGVAAPLGAGVGRFGLRGAVGLLKQDAEVERAVGVAAAIGPPVGRLGSRDVAATLQQDSKTARGGRMTAEIRAHVRLLRACEVGPLLEQGTQSEATGGTSYVCARSVSPLGYPSQAINKSP